MAKPMMARLPDDDERLSLDSLSFEDALQAALAVDPAKVDAEEVEPDGDGS